MPSRVDRIALNEAAHRAGNERMHAWPERSDDPANRRHMFLCECGDSDCRGRLWLTETEYEAVRADELRFAVLVGHAIPDAERVLSEHDGRYLVVEKNEEIQGIVAQKYGPRTR